MKACTQYARTETYNYINIRYNTVIGMTTNGLIVRLPQLGGLMQQVKPKILIGIQVWPSPRR